MYSLQLKHCAGLKRRAQQSIKDDFPTPILIRRRDILTMLNSQLGFTVYLYILNFFFINSYAFFAILKSIIIPFVLIPIEYSSNVVKSFQG